MSSQVQMPQKKSKETPWGAIGTIAGGVAGAALAGPGGALAGASAGASLGGTAGGVTQALTAPKTAQAPAGVQKSDDSAMGRRWQQASESNQLAELENGINALPTLPPESRAHYEPQLLDAYSYLRNKRGAV